LPDEAGVCLLSRLETLLAWVNETHSVGPQAITPASSDASFRRYFRVALPDQTLIVMDAPPDKEDCRPFVKVAELFAAAGVHVPLVLRQDLRQGFLMLTDLGNTTYLEALNAGADADSLYNEAFAALVQLQQASRPGVLPEYDEALLRREMDLFPDWYVARHLGMTLSTEDRAVLDDAMTRLLQNVLSQPRVYVHRDYHSRNLMVTEPNPGILDFQDAVYGPITYDAVSLLKDAYIRWEEDRWLDWLVRYWQRARAADLPVQDDFGEFYRDFEWMGVQRHLKVVGIFARLCHRDGKRGYLDDIPRVWQYLREACGRYRDLQPLAGLLDRLAGESVSAGYTF
jgi:aminoglycoside/choline kinase family phosphotransferase